MMNKPLDGVRVVELASVVAAPAASRMMADYGAEVIKIETPQGDILRPTGKAHLFPTEDNNNPMFELFNSGKKLVSLDLKTEEGRELMLAMLEDADVFISNVRMQSLEKLGLGYESLHKRLPKLVYAHFSGYGLKGPDANNPGFDLTAFWMRSGALVDTVPPDSFPIRPAFAFGDLASSSAFLSGIMMALYAVSCGGEGTMVNTSLYNAGLWCNSLYIMNSQPQYGRRFPVSRSDPWDPFADYYLCADGEWIGIMEKVYDVDRPKVSAAFGFPELMTEPELQSITEMRAAGKIEYYSRRMQELISQKSSDEWIELLRSYDIPCERIRHFKDIPSDEQAWANGYLERVAYPDGVDTVIPVPPLCFSEYGRKPFERKGGVGQDTDEVLKNLGKTDAEIAELKKRKIVK